MKIEEFKKLKVGDRVRIRKDVDKSFGSVKPMYKYSGEIATIQKCVFEAPTPRIKIDLDRNIHDGWLGDGWCWTADMIECKVEDQPTIVEHLVKGNKIIVKLSNGKVGVAACSPDDEFDMCEGLKLAIDRAYGKVPGFKKDKAPTYKKDYITRSDKIEPVVKEVKRKAKVGEWIKIIEDSCILNSLRKGKLLKVYKIETTHFPGVYCELLDKVRNPYRNDKGNLIILDGSYVVLEGYEPEPEVKEVKRKAKVGEYIKIVDPRCTFGDYGKGHIFKVESTSDMFRGVTVEYYGENCCTYIRDDEYVVLENYKPKKK